MQPKRKLKVSLKFYLQSKICEWVLYHYNNNYKKKIHHKPLKREQLTGDMKNIGWVYLIATLKGALSVAFSKIIFLEN